MAFTYTIGAAATLRDSLRRKIGDTKQANPIFQDEELDAILAERSSSLRLSAATCFREMAARAARGAVFINLPGLSLSKISLPAAFHELADKLEQEAEETAVAAETNVKLETDQLLDVNLGDQDFNFETNTDPNT